MIIPKMGDILHGPATGSAIEAISKGFKNREIGRNF